MGCEFIDKGEEDPRSYLVQFDEKSGVQMHVFDFEAVAVQQNQLGEKTSFADLEEAGFCRR